MSEPNTPDSRGARTAVSSTRVVTASDRLITRPFVVVTLAASAFFMYIGTLVPLVPLFIEGPVAGGELGLGLNAAVFAVAAIAARPMIGRLADRHGRRAVIVGGALIAAASGIGMSQVASLLPILGLRAVTGVGEAAVFVGAATLIADLSPAHRRAEGASYFSVAVFTGLGVGPVFGEWLLDDVQFERAFLVASGFAVLASLVALFAPARVVSAAAAAADGAATSDDGEPSPASHGSVAPAPTGLRRFVHPAALGPGVVLACGVGGLTTFFLFIPDHARTVGMSDSGLLFATYAALSLVVRVFGAKLPERLGVRRAVTVALVATGSGLLLLAVVAEIWALWVSAALVGLGAAFNYPSLMALTVNRVSEAERATAISSFTMFFEIGTAASGLAVGGLAQLVGKQMGFFGGVAFCVVGLVILRARIAPVTPVEPATPTPVNC